MNIDEAIREALKETPKIEDYTIKELIEKFGEPWPTERWIFCR